MKHITTQSARTVWLFHVGDLNPQGKGVWGEIMSGLASRYSFAKTPDLKEIIEARQKNQPYVLKGGIYRGRTGAPIEIALTIHGDGIWVDTYSSTNDCDEFLAEMLEWAHAELGLVDYKTLAIKKIYVSEIVVSMSRSLNSVSEKLRPFLKVLEEKLPTTIKNPTYELGAVQFWIDPELKPQHVHFRLERQEGVPFAENRYYSIAPLRTEDHLEVLEVLERTVLK